MSNATQQAGTDYLARTPASFAVVKRVARLALFGIGLGAFAVGAIGCGGAAAPVPMPSALLGVYNVTVEENSKIDNDVMTVVAGSGSGVVLTFTIGIGPIHCTVQGSTGITIPRQALDVDHSTGVATGTASGFGHISADGSADISFSLNTPGFNGPADGGATANIFTYQIVGMRQSM